MVDWEKVGGNNKPANNATRNVFTGTWTSDTTYAIGDIVTYSNNSWSCIQVHTSSGTIVPPTTSQDSSTYWTLYGAAGSSAISAVLSNEAHVLPADSTGAVTSYTGSGTTIRVYEGTTELVYDGIGTANSSWKVTTTATNITVGTITDSGIYATIGVASGVASGTDTSSIVYTITGKNSSGTSFTITKTQTLSKSKSGSNGTNGTSPLIYDIVTSAPVITKDAPDANTTGTYSSISIQGKKYDGSTTTNYGWITVTANTDTEATSATDTSVTAFTLNPAAGTSSYTIKMYNQATVSGATLLDTQVVYVVFKGATGAAGPSGKNATINYASSELWDYSTTNTNAYAPLGTDFTVVGDSNQRLWRSNYNGLPALVWVSKNNDTASDADAGWDKQVDTLSSNKSYLSFVYFRRVSTATSGYWYHGCSTTSTLNMDGSTNSNPYFNTTALSAFEQNEWYVSIGLIHANNSIYTSNTGFSGIYKVSTGKKILAGTDFKMVSGATTQNHRTYLYYSTDPSVELEWYWPGFFEINGNEPSLQDLVSASNINGLNPITATNVSTYIANAAIGAAQIGSIQLVGTNNFSVKTGVSGARMEMDSKVIKVYDANGVLRVKLGDLSA